jgi:hypothetical protein
MHIRSSDGYSYTLGCGRRWRGFCHPRACIETASANHSVHSVSGIPIASLRRRYHGLLRLKRRNSTACWHMRAILTDMASRTAVHLLVQEIEDASSEHSSDIPMQIINTTKAHRDIAVRDKASLLIPCWISTWWAREGYSISTRFVCTEALIC